MTDSQDQNLAAQERLGQLLAAHQPERLPEVLADDVVDHDPAPDQAPGAAGLVGFWTDMFTAFPDLTTEPLTMVADDDKIAVVLDLAGTHTGPFQGHEPTGKSFRVRGLQVARFEDGKVVERWGATDQAGMLQQLGLS